MKKIVLFIVFALVLSPLHSCKKEEDQEPESSNSYRLTQIVEDNLYKFDFIYDEDRIKRIDFTKDKGNDDWELIRQIQVEYDTDLMSLNYYYDDFYSSDMILEEKVEFIFENDKVVERNRYIYQDDVFNHDRKNTYHYYENKLSEIITYHVYEDFSTTRNFTYNNGLLIEIEGDSENTSLELEKLSFQYSDSRIAYVTLHIKTENDWNPVEKHEYLYTGNLLTTLKLQSWDSENNLWDECVQCTQHYSYNGNDYLAVLNSDSDEFNEIVFHYEESVGNLNDIIPPIYDESILGVSNSYMIFNEIAYY